jgi:hypothetical protein
MSPDDSTIIIGKYPLKISLAAHRARVVVDMRFQYLPANGDRLMPTRRGVTFVAAALPEIIAALEKLKALMVHDGYMDEGSPPKINPHVYPSDF